MIIATFSPRIHKLNYLSDFLVREAVIGRKAVAWKINIEFGVGNLFPE